MKLIARNSSLVFQAVMELTDIQMVSGSGYADYENGTISANGVSKISSTAYFNIDDLSVIKYKSCLGYNGCSVAFFSGRGTGYLQSVSLAGVSSLEYTEGTVNLAAAKAAGAHYAKVASYNSEKPLDGEPYCKVG